MFEQLRDSLRSLLENSPSAPADRRAALTDLRAALVRARMGVDDLRGGVESARQKLAAARAELDTIQRRKALATQINDAETVAVAERFEGLQTERVDVLARKLDAQERELAFAEREVSEMSADFRRAVAGVGSGTVGKPDADRAAAAEVDAMLGEDAALSGGLDARLAELKRRMGK